METDIPKFRGVTLTAVVMWFIAAIFMLGATLFLVPTRGSGATTSSLRASNFEFSSLCWYLAIAIGVLAFGLMKRKSWAWDGTVCALSLGIWFAVMLFLRSLNFPTTTLQVAVGFAIVVLIGTLPLFACLRYLCRAGTRRVFGIESYNVAGQPCVWIRLIAAQCILTSGTWISEGMKPTPSLVFGFPLHGVFQVMYALAVGSTSIYVGYGLYKMSEVAWASAIGFTTFLWAETMYWLVTTPTPQPGPSYMRIGFACTSSVISAATILYLFAKRNDFRAVKTPHRSNENGSFHGSSNE